MPLVWREVRISRLSNRRKPVVRNQYPLVKRRERRDDDHALPNAGLLLPLLHILACIYIYVLPQLSDSYLMFCFILVCVLALFFTGVSLHQALIPKNTKLPVPPSHYPFTTPWITWIWTHPKVNMQNKSLVFFKM